MALATPTDREFRVLLAGYIRDSIVLANFREGLRNQVDPETGAPVTEETIARATRAGSRWYNEAQAIDDYGQGEQRNALYLADQVRLDRATGQWLVNVHGKLWSVSLLPATGGSGPVTIGGTAGTIVVGSTTIGDPGAYTARDPNGNVYQVFQGGASSAVAGNVVLTMIAVGTGSTTNPAAGTVLTWITRDPNMAPTATVADDFEGGTDQETEAELADRIAAIIRYRPGAGNDSHWRTWAREASNSVEDAFVYPCALHAGSVAVAITQKRKTTLGPNGRIASAGTLATVIAHLVAPASPVAPSKTFVIAASVQPETSDVVVRLGMQRASRTGWSDAQPFPAFNAATPQITTVSAANHFTMVCPGDATLPGQAALATMTAPNVPQIMLWNAAKSTWETLVVSSIIDHGSNSYEVLLSSPPSFAITPGQLVSPATLLASIISGAMGEYFDELGPGDFFDVTTDPRGQRCVRFPSNLTEWPTQAGASIMDRVLSALGGTTANGSLASISKTSPSFQSSIQLGPNMLTLGNAAVYAP